jgi:hypothetical protein
LEIYKRRFREFLCHSLDGSPAKLLVETFLQKNMFVPTYKCNCERNNLNPGEIIVVLIKAEFDPGHSKRGFVRLEQNKAQRTPDFGIMWR